MTKDLRQEYSRAQGVHVSWNTNVNLDPPKVWSNEKPKEDMFIKDYYNSLQYALFETGCPETIDRTSIPRTKQIAENVAIAILSSPVECIGTLLEGGRRLSDGFHLILSPSWLSKDTSGSDINKYTLYIHKAVTFHADGSTYIDEFECPRRITYFLNFMTTQVTGGQRNDGVELEKNLDCPRSSSVQLCDLVDDKVWTRYLMASVGIEIPETLAFALKPKRNLKGVKDKMVICELNDGFNIHTVMQNLNTFLPTLFARGKMRVVVKPSGPGFFGSVGVSYHEVSDVTSIADAVYLLLTQIDDGCSVLVESFVEHLTCKQTDYKQPYMWVADDTLGFRVRATICRDHQNVPVTTLITCGIASRDLPINGDNTICQSLETTLLAYNIHDKCTRQKLEIEIREQSEAVLQAIINYEKQLSEETKGGKGAQTDIIGIDYIISMKDNQLIPVGIEVNSHDCTINCQIFEFMTALWRRTVESNSAGELINVARMTENFASIGPWVENMISRSQQYIMKGKCVLVIGAGGYSKRQIWPDAARYGVQIILVDSHPRHTANKDVHTFIYYDFDVHGKDSIHACKIVDEMRRLKVQVDGCLTFWEDCVPLAALVSEKLGTTGSSFEAATNAKKKSRTQMLLRMRKDDIPHWPRTYLYSSEMYPITTETDLQSVSDRIKFPSVLKLEHGSSAIGVSLVSDINELSTRRMEVAMHLRKESDFPGVGLGHDNSMFAMDYHGGSEHDVDVVIFDRKLLAAFISDNGPTRIPNFTETVAVMPSCLPNDKQAQIVTAAYQCCTEIGLSNGTFNAEFKMTASGPKLIEINGRMGGYYLRDWIQYIYGVDIMLCSLMISCGVKPYIPRNNPVTHLAGIMVLPSLHRHILDDRHLRKTIEDMCSKGEIIFSQFSQSLDAVSDMHEEPFANIAAKGRTTKEAKEKLLKICKLLNIDSDAYKVEEFANYFY